MVSLLDLAYWPCVIVGLLWFTNVLHYLIRTYKRLRMKIDFTGYAPRSWAVVTGATDGAGKALAFELAKNGFNVFLVSRTQEKLEAVAAEIREKHPVETKVFAIDFSVFNLAAYQALEASLQDLDISFLCNVVGYAYSGYFSTLPLHHVLSTLFINIWPQVYLTYALDKKIRAATSRFSVLTVASYSSHYNQPFSVMYGATKAFNYQFALGVSSGYTNPNVNSTILSPNFIETKMASPYQSYKKLFISTDYFVYLALAAATSRVPEHTGAWKQELVRLQSAIAPEDFISRKILKNREANFKP